MRTSISAPLQILTILVVISSMMYFTSADDGCRGDITRDKSWNIWLKELSSPNASKKDLCDDKDDCGCEQTMFARRKNTDSWNYARALNEQFVKERQDEDLDIVMVGDSIVEKWHGTKQGEPQEQFQGNKIVYAKYFDPKNGILSGLALGVGSDRVPHLLYHLGDGYLDSKLDPRAWWVLIGTNDVSAGCKDEYIIAGIINIVMKILKERPGTIVVINSLLPRGKTQLFKRDKFIAINEALKCFAGETGNVEYFDADRIFLKNGLVNLKLLPDGLHPQKAGAEAWAKEIVKFVERLM